MSIKNKCENLLSDSLPGKLQSGDSLSEKPQTDEALLDDKPVLNILYQDEYLVAVDKPAGLFVHRSFMDNDEKYFALQLVRDQVGRYVYPIHRLDRPTSGVLLFALNEDIARELNRQFSERLVTKTYYALVRGFLEGSGIVDYALKEKLDKIGDKFADKDKPAQSAVTSYHSVAQAVLYEQVGKFDTVRYSLVKLQPKTGRRHQIRRHLSHLRHPIIGDVNYGDNKQNPFFHRYFGFKRLMLIAKSLTFTHPVTQELITVEADFDEQWCQFIGHVKWSLEEILSSD